MDLFRSKKRGSEPASVGEVPESLQKRHRNMSGSVDDLLENAGDSQDEVFSDASSSESEHEDIQKASKMQKMFAKKLIKRDKRKEKEHRRKVEKNLISMDDFLGKQSEFKMWLYEEKCKNAGSLSSPKLKTYFKQFVRLWNKHKLLPKYYKSSTLPESPRSPLTPREFNLMSQDSEVTSEPTERNSNVTKKEPPASPFVTFGKTPPKVFKSKKLQLFSSNQDVALISVMPLESVQQTTASNKEKPHTEEPCQYRVPSVKPKRSSNNQLQTPSPQFIGATPYKVSVYSWAVGDTTECDADQSLEVCSTDTPPNLSHVGPNEQDDWPPPPTDIELNCQSTSDSPHVPPPPPPRVESLPKSGYDTTSMKSEGSDYSDPYDKLPEKPAVDRDTGGYQDPVDCVEPNLTANVKPEMKLVLKTFVSNIDEPDSSMYCNPVPLSEKRLCKEELEEMYAKPVKRPKKTDEKSHESTCNTAGLRADGGLYAEIMAHLNKRNLNKEKGNKEQKQVSNSDPHYESIDELMGKIEKNKEVETEKEIETDKNKDCVYKPVNVIEEMKKLPEFSGLGKSKKSTVLAASSDKIYETYLSLGRNVNLLKNNKTDIKSEVRMMPLTNTLKKRHKSQPDISFSENIQLYVKNTSIPEMEGIDTREKDKPSLSSFKPASKLSSNSSYIENSGCFVPMLKEQQKSQSCEENLSMIETPRTPIILSTPSFESLCQVTPLHQRSESSQSLPVKSGSCDNLSGSDSFMSLSTSSSLSCGPNDHSASIQSLHSDKSLSPVPEETEKGEIEEADSSKKYEKPDIPTIGALTPGKMNAAKHGIDLSVYLLKPTHQNEHATTKLEGQNQRGQDQRSVSGNAEENTQTNSRTKMFDNHSRLAIKETLSGLKTKVELSTVGSRKDIERRHTVQTIKEMKEGYIIHKKPDSQNQVPNIGLAAKVRKFESGNKSLKSKWDGCFDSGEVKEPFNKRHRGETEPVGVDKDHYLETDIDSVLPPKPKQTMKRSKSHSGIGSAASANVVTDIW